MTDIQESRLFGYVYGFHSSQNAFSADVGKFYLLAHDWWSVINFCSIFTHVWKGGARNFTALFLVGVTDSMGSCRKFSEAENSRNRGLTIKRHMIEACCGV